MIAYIDSFLICYFLYIFLNKTSKFYYTTITIHVFVMSYFMFTILLNLFFQIDLDPKAMEKIQAFAQTCQGKTEATAG